MGVPGRDAEKRGQLTALEPHERFLSRRGQQCPVLCPQEAAAKASPTARPRRVTVIQNPVVHLAWVMKPYGVIETGCHEVLDRISERVRIEHCAQQRVV